MHPGPTILFLKLSSIICQFANIVYTFLNEKGFELATNE